MRRIAPICSALWVSVVLSFGACSAPANEYNVRGSDFEVASGVKSTGHQVQTPHAYLWFEKDELSPDQVFRCALEVESAIVSVRRFLRLATDTDQADNEKITYIASDRVRVPHAHASFVFIPSRLIAENHVPYVHETVHAIAEQMSGRGSLFKARDEDVPLWLIEGLAGHIEQDLASVQTGARARSGHVQRQIDSQVRAALRGAEGLRDLPFIGTCGAPVGFGHDGSLDNVPFYLEASSFVGFLVNHVGIERVMQLYAERTTPCAVFESKARAVTFRSLQSWRENWLRSLGIDGEPNNRRPEP
jgi:hypothetical protein